MKMMKYIRVAPYNSAQNALYYSPSFNNSTRLNFVFDSIP